MSRTLRPGAQFRIRSMAATSHLKILLSHAVRRALPYGVLLAGLACDSPVAPRVPASLAINGGNSQSATAGAAVFTAPSVSVKDSDGNAVSGVRVTFSAASGNGSVTGPNPLTDNSGIAAVGSWILSTVAGQNTLTATIAELPSAVATFTATGNPGPAATITLVSGDGQSALAGRPVRGQILFRVRDANGNDVAGATVSYSVTSGAGSVATPSVQTLSSGVAVLAAGDWTLGRPAGSQTVTATVNGLSGQSATVAATAAILHMVTFGDSNTDFGFSGTDPTIVAASYISSDPSRASASAPNHSTQLAGKIEALWSASYSSAVSVVNHGVTGTTTDSVRSTAGAPGMRTRSPAAGNTRFQGEVLAANYPWSGGEPVNSSFPNGPIARTRAFSPSENDFAYVSIGTNDAGFLIQPTKTVENLDWMIGRWLNEGLAADHLIITTLAPSSSNDNIWQINPEIRAFATSKGVKVIDLAAYTSNDDGRTWKDASLHIGDGVHYAESVRQWLAQQVVSIIAGVTSVTSH